VVRREQPAPPAVRVPVVVRVIVIVAVAVVVENCTHDGFLGSTALVCG
jgi:hypothetical protein